MKIEQQVCSLEWAKKLKALGVKQESYFNWYEYQKGGNFIATNREAWSTDTSKSGFSLVCSAFTVAELLAIAPASTSIQKRTDLETKKNARYYVEDFDHYRKEDYDENPANALAKFLVENKLI